MTSTYSLAYLAATTCTVPEALRLAAELGYCDVGLRLAPNAPGAPMQELVGQAGLLREVLALQRDTGIGVLDLEIIRIAEGFDPRAFVPFLETGQALGARAVLVAGDDSNLSRMADGFARLCELMQPYGMTADLEFMPWTAVGNARVALQVVRDAGSPPQAGILVDALHFDRSTTTLDDLRAIPASLFHYAQICDAKTQAQWGRPFTHKELVHTAREERLLPGEGGIGLKELLAVLPPGLPLSLEIPSVSRIASLGQREWARLALQASRAIFSP